MSAVERLALAFSVGLPLAFLAAWLGRRFGLLDRPSAIKPHPRPVPYMGGAAILLATLAASVGALSPLVTVGGILAWLVGAGDDVWHLRPLPKLLATAPAVLAGVAAFGLAPGAAVVAALAGLLLMNAFNVVDGLDALAGGVAAVMLLAAAAVPGSLAPFAAAALGAVLAFLVLNRPPARLFMGDQGSLFLGYVLWVVPLAGTFGADGTPAPWWAALWLFPLVNLAFVVAMRLREGRPPLTGDRSHLYDVLYRRYGLAATLLMCWGIAGAGAVAVVAGTPR